MKLLRILPMSIFLLSFTRLSFGSEPKTVTNVTQRPYNCICYLEAIYDQGPIVRGTGFLVSNKVVITAAHVLFNRDSQKKASTVLVYQGRHGDESACIGSFMVDADNIVVCSDYLNPDLPENTKGNYDYGAVIIEGAAGISKYLTPINYTSLVGMNVLTAGYPHENTVMYKSSGSITKCENNAIYTDVPGGPGYSGAPLLSSTNLNVVGILPGGDTETIQFIGLRMNDSIYDTIEKWIKENP